MEYGTKAWMGAYIDHHPNQRIEVINIPSNRVKERYGCELLGPALIDPHQSAPPQASGPPSGGQRISPSEPAEISARRLELGVDSRIRDPGLDDQWEYFVETVCGGDVSFALDEVTASAYDNKRAFIYDANKAYKKRNGLAS